MKKFLSVGVALMLAAVACAQSKAPPSSMPREKALIVQAAFLKKTTLDDHVRQAYEALQPELIEAQAVLDEFKVGPHDSIDYKTGAITRPPKPPVDGGITPSK